MSDNRIGEVDDSSLDGNRSWIWVPPNARYGFDVTKSSEDPTTVGEVHSRRKEPVTQVGVWYRHL